MSISQATPSALASPADVAVLAGRNRGRSVPVEGVRKGPDTGAGACSPAGCGLLFSSKAIVSLLWVSGAPTPRLGSFSPEKLDGGFLLGPTTDLITQISAHHFCTRPSISTSIGSVSGTSASR